MSTRTDAPTTSWWRFLVVVITVGAAALMGACDRKGATTTAEATAEASTAPPAPTTPREALLAALPTKDSERFAFTSSNNDGTSSGVVDPAAHGLLVDRTIPQSGDGAELTLSGLMINADKWARVKYAGPVDAMPGLTDLPDKWLHLDNAKVSAAAFPDATDMSDILTIAAMLDHSVDVTETSPGKFAGTLDLSEVKDEDLLLVNVSDAGETAKAVPFEAEVDSSGRLTSLVLKWPATSADEEAEIKMTLSDFGSAPAVTAPPAGETEEAPESLYEILG